MKKFCFCKILLLFVSLLPGLFSLDKKEQSKILASSFEGNWQMTGDFQNPSGKYSPFDERDMNSGSAIIYFNSNSKKYDSIDHIVVELLMPEYYDQKMIRLMIDFKKPYSDELQRWENKQNCSY